jgi:hypothetical protein
LPKCAARWCGRPTAIRWRARSKNGRCLDRLGRGTHAGGAAPGMEARQ